MKRMLLTAVLLAGSVAVASAAGLNVNWGTECYGDVPVSALTWTCTSNTYAGTRPGAAGSGVIGITCSYSLPVAKTNVVATDLYMEGGTNNTLVAVPDWWRLGDGECRGEPNVAAPVSLTGVYGGSGACFDYYAGTGLGGIGLYSDEGARAHINATWAVPDPLGEIPAETEVFAATFKIKTAKTVGDGACGGCTAPFTWALNYIQIAFQGEPNSLQLGIPIANQCLSWNGGYGGFLCWGDDARRTTWGQVKSLYR